MLCHHSPSKLTHHVSWLPSSTGDVSLVKILELSFPPYLKKVCFMKSVVGFILLSLFNGEKCIILHYNKKDK